MHTITSPNTIIPVAPIALMIAVVNNTKNANVSNKIVNRTILFISFHNTICNIRVQKKESHEQTPQLLIYVIFLTRLVAKRTFYIDHNTCLYHMVYSFWFLDMCTTVLQLRLLQYSRINMDLNP